MLPSDLADLEQKKAKKEAEMLEREEKKLRKEAEKLVKDTEKAEKEAKKMEKRAQEQKKEQVGLESFSMGGQKCKLLMPWSMDRRKSSRRMRSEHGFRKLEHRPSRCSPSRGPRQAALEQAVEVTLLTRIITTTRPTARGTMILYLGHSTSVRVWKLPLSIDSRSAKKARRALIPMRKAVMTCEK